MIRARIHAIACGYEDVDDLDFLRSDPAFKLVVDDASDRVVGLHVVGQDAAEMAQGFAVAMKAGATKAVFDQTIGIHPTMAEELVTLRELSRT